LASTSATHQAVLMQQPGGYQSTQQPAGGRLLMAASMEGGQHGPVTQVLPWLLLLQQLQRAVSVVLSCHRWLLVRAH
jgi:hypothetical protein